MRLEPITETPSTGPLLEQEHIVKQGEQVLNTPAGQALMPALMQVRKALTFGAQPWNVGTSKCVLKLVQLAVLIFKSP